MSAAGREMEDAKKKAVSKPRPKPQRTSARKRKRTRPRLEPEAEDDMVQVKIPADEEETMAALEAQENSGRPPAARAMQRSQKRQCNHWQKWDRRKRRGSRLGTSRSSPRRQEDGQALEGDTLSSVQQEGIMATCEALGQQERMLFCMGLSACVSSVLTDMTLCIRIVELGH